MDTHVSKITSNLSYVPIHLTTWFGDTALAIGTAFVYERNGSPWLITNWHNVTGRRPSDHGTLSQTGAIPDSIVVRIPHEKKVDDGVKMFRWEPTAIDLYSDEDCLSPVWFEHPTHRERVDLVALPFKDISGTRVVPVNSEALDLDRLKMEPGMDVFVLGYPRGISGGGRFPIWKRGSIASEPDVDIENLPMLYIDTATREGMSGAPVYAQESGFWAPEGSELPEGGVFGKGHRFIGIYSGRVGNDSFLAQLGIVWKEEAIVETIDGESIGTSSNTLFLKPQAA